jgi:outer membrane protein OmpA-like peptidoglycan-associated protein
LEADSKLTAAKIEADAKLAAAKNEADQLRLDNEAQKIAAQAAEARALQQKTQLEADKVAMRAQLLQQFNAILTTQDTARGLIVSMPDVLFDTAKHTLRPLAREKLAKVAGIISGHPGLKLEVEGHTDSVGTEAYNQTLSEQRSESVRSYLTEQGMMSSSVTSKGMGENQPVASNDSAAGRQQNRRVEIVVSGEMIGQNISPR